MMDLAQTLAGFPRFAGLPKEDLEALARSVDVQQHHDGHVFMTEGDRVDGCFLILDGQVSVTRNRPPYIDELTRLGPGDLFGVVALVDSKRRAATCSAIGDVKVAAIPGGVLDMLLEHHTPLALAMQRLVADQLAKDFRKVVTHLREALEQRAAR